MGGSEEIDGQFYVEMDFPYPIQKVYFQPTKEKANVAKKQFYEKLPHQTHSKFSVKKTSFFAQMDYTNVPYMKNMTLIHCEISFLRYQRYNWYDEKDEKEKKKRVMGGAGNFSQWGQRCSIDIMPLTILLHLFFINNNNSNNNNKRNNLSIFSYHIA